MSRKTAGRLLAAALCTLMAAASCLAVFAAGNTVTIKECDDLQLTLPDNMTAVTRSSEATDPYFVQHKVSYDGLMQSFRDGDIYMQAMDNDNTYTVQLSYLDTGAQDFNELTTEQIDSVSRNFLGGTDAELQYSACTPDQIPDGLTWLYLKMSITDPDTGVSNQYQATTVFSGKNITLTLFRNEGDVEGSDYDVLQSIARSVKANRAFSFRKILPFLLIAGGILLAVVLAVVIVKLVKRFKNPDPEKNKKDNDKVIEELAGKYQMRTKPVAIEPSPEQAEQKLDKKPEPQEAPVEIDDAQRRIIRKDFSAEGEAYESKHTAEEAEEPVIEKRELVKPEQKKTEAPAPQTEDYVDIYAESPECRRAREEAEAAEAAAAAAEAQAQAQAQVQTQQAPAPEAAPEPVAEEKPEPEPAPAPEEKKVDYRRYLDDDDDFDDDTATPVRRYSDEDIERLLADTEDSENFNLALPSNKADSAVAEVRDSAKAAPVVIRLRSTTQTAPAANSFAGSANSHTVQILLSSLRSKLTAAVHTDRVHPQQTEPSASDGQNDGETAMTDNQLRQTMEEATDDASAGGELNVTEEWGDSAQEPYAPEIFQTETVFEKNQTDDMPLDSVLEKPLIRPDLRPTMRLRLLLNENEIPSREELEKQTFNDSSDFFEEAPDRISGAVTSEELEEDVLPAPQKEQKHTAASNAQKPGVIKGAGTRVGYFFTNIGRAVKRKRVLSKRKKAEEERRRRQIERRRQERAAMERRRAGYGSRYRTNNDNRKQ